MCISFQMATKLLGHKYFLSFFFFLNIFIEVQLPYNGLLASALYQSESVIHIQYVPISLPSCISLPPTLPIPPL